jgi:H/ACA ribonucleoprotein complex subunit 4
MAGEAVGKAKDAEGIEERLQNGVIIIDKPPGLTSHEVTTLVKKIAGAKRAGHAGTLDPEVSGVLPVAIGRATKLLRYIAAKDKTYVGIVKFKKVMSASEIEAIFKKFTGELVQTPPKISAVRKVPRKRTVYRLKLLDTKEHLALFDTNVDAGTYIRTLCDDMGKTCGGARMEELRRTAVGRIDEKKCHTMQELVDAMWFYKNGDAKLLSGMVEPPERFIELPKAFIKETALASVLSGAQIMAPGVEEIDAKVAQGDRVAIYCNERFVGIGIAQVSLDGLKKMESGIVIKLERVHR